MRFRTLSDSAATIPLEEQESLGTLRSQAGYPFPDYRGADPRQPASDETATAVIHRGEINYLLTWSRRPTSKPAACKTSAPLPHRIYSGFSAIQLPPRPLPTGKPELQGGR